jgi:uncharacterized protein YjiS (DUF1127 family)
MEAEMTTVHDTTTVATRGGEALRILRARLWFFFLTTGMRLAAPWHRLKSESRRRRAERELEALPEDTLKDIGIARSEIPWLATGPSELWRGGYNDPG